MMLRDGATIDLARDLHFRENTSTNPPGGNCRQYGGRG